MFLLLSMEEHPLTNLPSGKPGAVQVAQDLGLQRLSPKSAPKVADPVLQVPDDHVAGDVIVIGHGALHPSRMSRRQQYNRLGATPLRRATTEMLARSSNVSSPIRSFLGGTPAATRGTIGDDPYLKNKYVPRRTPEPPW